MQKLTDSKQIERVIRGERTIIGQYGNYKLEYFPLEEMKYAKNNWIIQ